MECVSICSSTQIAITDSQFHGKPICRGFDYYVDASSGSYMELGTKQYPYKNIELVFVEILNFHSNSNRNLSVKVMENTDNYVGGILISSLRAERRPIMLVNNITSVTVESYSNYSFLTPGAASIYFTSSSSLSADPKTMFNIMNHTQAETESDINSHFKKPEMIRYVNNLSPHQIPNSTILINLFCLKLPFSFFLIFLLKHYNNYSFVLLCKMKIFHPKVHFMFENFKGKFQIAGYYNLSLNLSKCFLPKGDDSVGYDQDSSLCGYLI